MSTYFYLEWHPRRVRRRAPDHRRAPVTALVHTQAALPDLGVPRVHVGWDAWKRPVSEREVQ